jgi:hypothetical protein
VSSDEFAHAVENESLRLLKYLEARESDIIVIIMALHSVYISMLHVLKTARIPPAKLIPLVSALKAADDEELGKVAKWVYEEMEKVDNSKAAAGIA